MLDKLNVYLLIFCVYFVVIGFSAFVRTTTIVPETSTGNNTLISSNTSLDLKVRRKSVLIINPLALRTKGKKRDDGTTHSLAYMDYDDKGTKLNEFWMHSLDDVIRFFEIFLDTRVCRGQCDD